MRGWVSLMRLSAGHRMSTQTCLQCIILFVVGLRHTVDCVYIQSRTQHTNISMNKTCLEPNNHEPWLQSAVQHRMWSNWWWVVLYQSGLFRGEALEVPWPKVKCRDTIAWKNTNTNAHVGGEFAGCWDVGGSHPFLCLLGNRPVCVCLPQLKCH